MTSLQTGSSLHWWPPKWGRIATVGQDQASHEPSLAQVFYHLGELDDALGYALGAGTRFDVNDTSEYVQCLVGECVL
jgi:hypothetical protein